MPKIAYIQKRLSAGKLDVIEQANAICEEYAAQGLVLTLRQLYYQFVARDLLANKQTEYKRLGDICADARMTGLMDWDYLIDRTRNLVTQPHWDSPADIMASAASSFRTDRWAHQDTRVQVWIEKDAGIGVIEGVCEEEDVPYFSCRGYTSISEMWASAQRLGKALRSGQDVVVLHIGDHDPSGLDMSRDIEQRLIDFITTDKAKSVGKIVGEQLVSDNVWAEYGVNTFPELPEDVKDYYLKRVENITNGYGELEVKRIALNYDQVEEYQPPPNPAKTTDSRYERYVDETGLDESWELDALDPVVLQDLIRSEIEAARDEELWEVATTEMERQREDLQRAADEWETVVRRLRNGDES